MIITAIDSAYDVDVRDVAYDVDVREYSFTIG